MCILKSRTRYFSEPIRQGGVMELAEFDLQVMALKLLILTAEKAYKVSPPETRKQLLKEYDALRKQMKELLLEKDALLNLG